MRIACSAEKGEMEYMECLSCALTGQQPCGYDYSLLQAMFKHDMVDRANEIHVTDLTGCLRKAWYDKQGEQIPEFVHERLMRWLGTTVHSHTEDNDEFMDSEVKLSAEEIVGRADVVYKDGRLIDKKTTRWLSRSKVPYGSHGLQVNIYAWLLRKMGKEVTSLQIQYIDLSGPSKCKECNQPVRMIGGRLKCPNCLKDMSWGHLGALLVGIPIMTDEEVEEYVLPRRDALRSALEMGFAPEAEPGWLCAYCKHVDVCQPADFRRDKGELQGFRD